MNIRIADMFLSIDGEVNHFSQGRPSFFIRFAGCNLKCLYCDTAWAQDEEKFPEVSVEAILWEVKKSGCPNITITGGEPLVQNAGLKELVDELTKEPVFISIETNGSLPINSELDCTWVMDYKLPSSGMYHRMREEHFLDLGMTDTVKFVISDMKDFSMARKAMLFLREKKCAATWAVSAVEGALDPGQLVEWIKQYKMWDCILNVQLHKLINLKEGRADKS